MPDTSPRARETPLSKNPPLLVAVSGGGLALAAALALRTKLNPVWMILGGAALRGVGILEP